MSENINGTDMLASGGHTWMWSAVPRAEKVLATAGTKGVFSYVVSAGGRSGAIYGELRGTGSSLAAAHTALTALETALETLSDSGAQVAWADPYGRSGSYLVVVRYHRDGPRGHAADGKAVWQRYILEIRDNRP